MCTEIVYFQHQRTVSLIEELRTLDQLGAGEPASSFSHSHLSFKRCYVYTKRDRREGQEEWGRAEQADNFEEVYRNWENRQRKPRSLDSLLVPTGLCSSSPLLSDPRHEGVQPKGAAAG